MKILCVLYDDPKDGMPEDYPLSELPELKKYPDGMTLPTPKAIDFFTIYVFTPILIKFLEKRNLTVKDAKIGRASCRERV